MAASTEVISQNWISGESNSTNNINNNTDNDIQEGLPIDMRFTEANMIAISSYSVLMVLSALGNLTVLIIILRRRRASSRIHTMLMHLAIADLFVTFIIMPLEIAWAATVSWKGGDIMCRIMAFFRTFGLYLSSFVLICITLDRYYSVMKSLHTTDPDRRGRFMILIAWVFSVLFSLPQAAIFHVETHPNHTWYKQCLSYNVLPSKVHEFSYVLFGMVAMYFVPLTVFVFSYVSILAEIIKRSRDAGNDRFRRSSLGFLSRAKIRTLKMTIIIVLAFLVCWTPYNVMCVWFFTHSESFSKVDLRIKKALFLFACTNSCVNPVVYGIFNFRSAIPRRGHMQYRVGSQVHRNSRFPETCRLGCLKRPMIPDGNKNGLAPPQPSSTIPDEKNVL